MMCLSGACTTFFRYIHKSQTSFPFLKLFEFEIDIEVPYTLRLQLQSLIEIRKYLLFLIIDIALRRLLYFCRYNFKDNDA